MVSMRCALVRVIGGCSFRVIRQVTFKLLACQEVLDNTENLGAEKGA